MAYSDSAMEDMEEWWNLWYLSTFVLASRIAMWSSVSIPAPWKLASFDLVKRRMAGMKVPESPWHRR
jgi:hypothetical protein